MEHRRHTSLSSTGGSSTKSGTLLRSVRYEVPSSSSSNCNASSSARTLSNRGCSTGKATCQLLDLLRQARQVLHKISLETPVSRWLAPTNPPCHNAYSISSSESVHPTVMWYNARRTSILSISIFPYCFFISLFASFIASTVAIVFLKFSVAIAADSILNVCCASCASWPSYIFFCRRTRRARCSIAL